MRICFIADTSSIHVKRILSHHVRKKDDILILSSDSQRSHIPGTHIVHLLSAQEPALSIALNGKTRKAGLVTKLKAAIPGSFASFLKFSLKALRLFGKRRNCVAEIERFNPEVIYCFRSFPEGVLIPYCHVRPLLLRTAGADITQYTRYPVYRQIIRKILRAADRLVTESQWERAFLRDLCGAEVDPKVIIIGVDTTLFRPAVSQKHLRKQYGLPCDAFVVVSNRYLNSPYHGWLVVQAIQSILEQCPNLVLFYLIPYQTDLRTKAKIEAIGKRFPRIKFLEGSLPHSEMPEILGCGDAYISFSSFDGIPNSVLEAMACGLIPIVGELPQFHEWIEKGVTGYIVPQCDISALAVVVRDLYKNQQTLSDISVRCVSQIRELGSYEVCMERTRELLQDLIESNNREKTST